MNKSFLIIFIPAVLVAAMYLYMGIYPPRRVWIGVVIVAAALGAYRIRVMMQRGKTGRITPDPTPSAPAALSGTPQK